MIPESDIPDDDDLLDFVDSGTGAGPLHQIPKKLKYQDKGFQMQRSLDGKKWTLVRFYRSADDMRSAYVATKRGENWGYCQHRMIFPDGSILPKHFGSPPSSYGSGFYGRE